MKRIFAIPGYKLEVEAKGRKLTVIKKGPLGAGCFGGDFQIHITNSGEATPCDFTPLTFSNVQMESLRQIWKRIRRHPEYGRWRESCRMQNPAFRKRYIERIPENAELPYPIYMLDKTEN